MKNTGLLYVRTIFNLIIALYTSREVLQVLGVEDFGIYNVVGGVILMFGFLNNAMTAAVQRYMSFELGQPQSKRLNTIFNMSVTIHVFLALIIVLLAETIGLYILFEYLNIPNGRMYAAIAVYQFALFAFVMTVMRVPYLASILSHEKMGIYAIGTIFESSGKLIGIILLSKIYGDKLFWYGAVILSISIFTAIFYHIYCMRNFGECRYKWIWDKRLFREMFAYSSWSLWGGVASIIPLQGINILLNIFFGPAINAARGIAYQVNAAVSSLYSSFTQAVNPQIIKQYSAGNMEYMHQLIFRSCKYTYLLVLLLACPILLETSQILKIWLGTVPDHAVTFCRLVLITTLIDCISIPLIPAVNATGKIKRYQIVVGMLLILNLPLSYVALKLTGIPEYSFYVGIFVAVLTSTARLWICHSLVSFPICHFVSSVIFRIVPTTIIAMTSFLVPAFLVVSGARLVLSIITGLTVTLLAILLVGMDKSERQFALRSLANLKSKLW